MKILNNVSFEEVKIEFLKAEQYKLLTDKLLTSKQKHVLSEIVKESNYAYQYPTQVSELLHLSGANGILNKIPSDTTWFSIVLEDYDFENLFISGGSEWRNIFQKHKKIKDAAKAIKESSVFDENNRLKKIITIKQTISQNFLSGKLIIIKSSTEESYTLVDGNHRALAFQLKFLETNDKSVIPSDLILGLSPTMDNFPWINKS